MIETYIADVLNWLINHGLLILIVISTATIGYYRVPGIWSYVASKIPSLSFGKSTTNPISADVISLLNGMVASLPSITDETLHKQAVESCVSYAEAIIRQAGVVKAQDAPNDPQK